jgi:glycosyltransferase involved in cell wall biosynthesis
VRHNLEAVRALMDRVVPSLEHEVEFVFVGACARRLRGERRSNVTLDPDGDVARYAGPETVGLNPVVQGSGTNLKLLDYLAHGMPVLSTPFGLRGYEALAACVVTADIDAFPDMLRRDIRVPNGIRERLSDFEWDRIAQEALRIYEALLNRIPVSAPVRHLEPVESPRTNEHV